MRGPPLVVNFSRAASVILSSEWRTYLMSIVVSSSWPVSSGSSPTANETDRVRADAREHVIDARASPARAEAFTNFLRT